MNLSSVDRGHQVDVVNAFARDLAIEVEKAYMAAAVTTLLALAILSAPEVALLLSDRRQVGTGWHVNGFAIVASTVDVAARRGP